MPFVPLSSRISNLPMVIAGPILRRVRANSVSVWIATRYPDSALQLKLTIYDGQTVVLEGQTNGEVPNFHIVPSIGFQLRIITITALPVANSPGLVESKVYHYDIEFMGVTASPPSPTLLSPGIMSSAAYLADISYDSTGLPSFSLPPSAISKLIVAHGSCRKPHGGCDDDKYDALASISNLISYAQIASSGNDSIFASTRPHILCMTGDQIYADDVADQLLYMIRDAASELIRGDEMSTLKVPGTNEVIESRKFFPGLRHELMPYTGFSADKDVSKSHLILLSEYLCMYLFVWSDVLWPSNQDFPSHADLLWLPPDIPDYLKDEEWDLQRFKASLPAVRKVLANVCTYMVVDDHEITDDWNINIDWINDLATGIQGQKNQFTTRLVVSGMIAFNICQCWGNTPELYKYSLQGNGQGYPIIRIAESLVGVSLLNPALPEPAAQSEWDTAEQLVLPKLFDLTATEKVLRGGLDYDFVEVYHGSYQFIFLNTRTRRQYHKFGSSDVEFCALISNESLLNQVHETLNTQILTFFISAAPVIGAETIENLIGQADVAFGRRKLDMEAWAYDPYGSYAIMSRISNFRYAIILSGDVHYGFSRDITYWRDTAGGQLVSKIAQFVSSSLLNSKAGTLESRDVHLKDRQGWYWLAWPTGTLDFYWFATPGRNLRYINGFTNPRKDTSETYPSFKLIYHNNPAMNWANVRVANYAGLLARYRIKPLYAPGTITERGIRQVVDYLNGVYPISYPVNSREYINEENNRIEAFNVSDSYCGMNNISIITFEWDIIQNIRKVKNRFFHFPVSIWNTETLVGGYMWHIVDFNDIDPVPPGEQP